MLSHGLRLPLQSDLALSVAALGRSAPGARAVPRRRPRARSRRSASRSTSSPPTSSPATTRASSSPDLTKDDIEVFEDGVAQDVASFTLVHGGRVYNLLAPPPPPPQEGIILPPSRPTNDAAGRIFLLFVDDLHLDFRNTGRIRDLFKKISKTLIHDGDMFGIVSTGPSSLAIDMTYDRKRLDEAIKQDHRQRPEAERHHRRARGRRGAERGALPRARGVLDGRRHRRRTSRRSRTGARPSST